jgi:hypothetical protein
MALQIDVNPPEFGYIPAKAYAKIDYIFEIGESTQIRVIYYENAEARANNEEPAYRKIFAVATQDLVGELYPACYAFIKTRPEFINAVDC